MLREFEGLTPEMAGVLEKPNARVKGRRARNIRSAAKDPASP
jgi:hypothetical protein